MKKLFVVVCQEENTPYLNFIEDKLWFSPIHEHVYRKFSDCARLIGLDVEVVHCSTYTLSGISNEIDCDLDDIIIFTHPLAFLAETSIIKDALDYVNSHELAYATVGSPVSLYATIGTGKMIFGANVNSPYDFIKVIQNCGANCEEKSFGDEKALPNDKEDYLKRLLRYREEYIDNMILLGISIEQRDGVLISPDSKIAPSAVILANTQIVTNSVIEANCMIGPNSVVSGSIICEGCVIDSSSVYASTIEKNVNIGPYSLIAESCHFLSNSTLGAYSKAQHSSIGLNTTIREHCVISNVDVGNNVYIGANVLTLDFDGRTTNESKISDGAFVGASVNIVSPVIIGKNSYIAAGSTITDDVPADSLSIARKYQTNHTEWSRRHKRNPRSVTSSFNIVNEDEIDD